MHTMSLRESASAGDARRDATFHASFPVAPDQVSPQPAPELPLSRFGERQRPNLVAIGAVALIHVGLLAALIQMNVIPIKPQKREPLVVELIVDPPAPPPAPPEQKVEPAKPVQPVVVAPVPIVQTLAPPPPVTTTTTPPPPQSAIVAPAAPAAPAAPVSAGDLSSNMISYKPPRYPTESRRKKEQGIVVLNLLLGLDGAVSQISVQKSSGFARLDEAALEAVRRWRWSPMMRGGQAMMVRGIVEIPFVIKT